MDQRQTLMTCVFLATGGNVSVTSLLALAYILMFPTYVSRPVDPNVLPYLVILSMMFHVGIRGRRG